jgi:hypothetical protein
LNKRRYFSFDKTIALATDIILLEPTYQHYYNRAELYFDHNNLDDAYLDAQAALKLNSFHEFSLQLKSKIEIKQAHERFLIKQKQVGTYNGKVNEFCFRLTMSKRTRTILLNACEILILVNGNFVNLAKKLLKIVFNSCQKILFTLFTKNAQIKIVSSHLSTPPSQYLPNSNKT